jgi:hypothetical protein
MRLGSLYPEACVLRLVVGPPPWRPAIPGKTNIQPGWRKIAQRIRLAQASDNVWEATPAAVQGLADVLLAFGNGTSTLSDGDVTVRMVQSFTRPAPATSTTISLDRSLPLDRADAVVFHGGWVCPLAFAAGVYAMDTPPITKRCPPPTSSILFASAMLTQTLPPDTLSSVTGTRSPPLGSYIHVPELLSNILRLPAAATLIDLVPTGQRSGVLLWMEGGRSPDVRRWKHGAPLQHSHLLSRMRPFVLVVAVAAAHHVSTDHSIRARNLSALDRVQQGLPVWWMIASTPPDSSTVSAVQYTTVSDETSPPGLTAALGGGGILVVVSVCLGWLLSALVSTLACNAVRCGACPSVALTGVVAGTVDAVRHGRLVHWEVCPGHVWRPYPPHSVRANAGHPGFTGAMRGVFGAGGGGVGAPYTRPPLHVCVWWWGWGGGG